MALDTYADNPKRLLKILQNSEEMTDKLFESIESLKLHARELNQRFNAPIHYEELGK
jgi:hypothetical protein